MKPKFLDFSTDGIVCPICSTPASYVGCVDHEGKYPSLEKNDTAIRIPNCDNCIIECSACDKLYPIPKFLHVFESEVKRREKLKLTPKTRKIKVIPAQEDRFDETNLRKIKDLDYFRNATFGTLDLLFCFDVGSQFGIQDMEKKLKSIGIPINLSRVHKINDKLSALLYALLMLRAAGLGNYEEQIMAAEIEKLYGSKDIKQNTLELRELLQPKKLKGF